MTSTDRRTVLKQGAALALASAIPSGAAHAATPVLRRSVGTMALNDPALNTYRSAIAAMKALPTSDHRNWNNQADIHLNHCPHGNWYFLPWHRAYLVAFERICRQLTGDASFALPYWDWTSNHQLPAAFTSQTYNNQPNPLYDGTRTISGSYSFPNSMVGQSVISQILAEPNFEIFGSSRPTGQNNTNAATWQRASGATGPLEGNPHNGVHGTIGGNMGQYISPRDPIFWLHHCNIDRIWQDWNDAGHSNTTDPLWKNMAFNGNFWAADGTTPYNVAPSGLLNINALGYRYKLIIIRPIYLQYYLLARYPLPPEINFAAVLAAAKVEVTAPARLNNVLSTKVTLSAAHVQALTRIKPLDVTALKSTDKLPQSGARVIAIIGDIDPPKSGNAQVRVFINCDYLTPETPTTDPSYAGTFSFFSDEHSGHAGKPSYIIDLTNAVTDLKRSQRPVGNEINVQLMPVPIAGGAKENVEFRPGHIQLAII